MLRCILSHYGPWNGFTLYFPCDALFKVYAWTLNLMYIAAALFASLTDKYRCKELKLVISHCVECYGRPAILLQTFVFNLVKLPN